MKSNYKSYISPFSLRYASEKISYLFSPYHRALLFRKLWTALAKAEKDLGLNITEKQIQELEQNIENIDFSLIEEYEKKFKHDVMAHIHAFGDLCPNAKSIIHLGATSCYVTDNADLIIIKESLALLKEKLLKIIQIFYRFTSKFSDLQCISFTHLQPAQMTTVGKRFCLYLQDFLDDYSQIEDIYEKLPFLGAKGATGTQNSFMILFNNDENKVKKLDQQIADFFNFKTLIPIASQTYSRKIDLNICNILESFASTCYKFANDIRLLSSKKTICEGFDKENQVGSSAMPHKKNPIFSERTCALARHLITLSQNASHTYATQWLERSLDDSANRRITLSEVFLTADSLASLVYRITSSLFVNEEMIQKEIDENLPYILLENILMACSLKGLDRQKIHEKLKKISHNSIKNIMEIIANDNEIPLNIKDIEELSSPSLLSGRASSQVKCFLEKSIKPILDIANNLGASIEEPKY